MSVGTKKVKKFFLKLFWTISAMAVIASTAYFGVLMNDFFYRTSYRFVGIFLLLIFASNLIAKIACAYIEA